MARSIFMRYWLYGRLVFFRSFVAVALYLRRKFGKYPRKTLSLSYNQSKLPERWSPRTVDVFFPGSYSLASSPQKRRPIYFDIHGGGFAIGDPTLDAHFCRYFSDAADCVVVSLPYRLTPFTRFPKQVYDLGSLVECVLTDERLKDAIDISKVAIGGFSAGGNLSTAVSILPQLKGKIHAAVPIYPVLDFTVTTEEKLKIRPPGPDMLASVGGMFDNAYVHHEQDKRHPLLSPYYAEPEMLPENLYVVGAELDMLNCDTLAFTKKFQPQHKNFVFEEIKGQIHGFTHLLERTRDPKKKAELEKVTTELYDRIATWLVSTVWMTRSASSMPDKQAGEELGGEAVVL